MWPTNTIHAGGSPPGRVLPSFVCVSVCLFSHDISNTDAAGITKLSTEMFQKESCKLINFGLKISKVKVTSHKKNIAGVGLCTLVSAGFF